ncbi:MAG: response regulator [Proteobacteria bacterium]|nr:response regulator [Pseudomonadota bacterium]
MTNTYGRILSVDDDPKVREKIATYLEDNGFVVYEANNGQEALESFHAKKPDLILCDLQMPVMGGLELLEILKKEAPEVPVIVISSTEKMSNVIEALRLGAWDFVPKPITNMTVLEHAVCKALERGRLVFENKRYRLELEEKNIQLSQSLGQLKEDQTAGKSVQQKLLPNPNFAFKDYEFSHRVIPSLYLSGDFVDYFQITPNKIGFYIADVSGHGASSAFITVMLKSLMERFLNNYQLRQDDIILHPAKVLKHLNSDIYNAKLGKYLTMIYCVLDLEVNTICYSVGGHYPNPIVWDGNFASFLDGSGFAVGIIKDAKFDTFTFQLPKEFTFAMFSDGIFEMMKGDLPAKEKELLSLFKQKQVKIDDLLLPLGIKAEGGGPDDITLLLMNRAALCKHVNK